MEFYEQLTAVTGTEQVLCSEPMSAHTTLRIGGPADYFVYLQNAGQLQQVLTLCKKQGVPYFLLGNGSNLLVADSGYRGVVLKLWKPAEPLCVVGNAEAECEWIKIEAGCLLSRAAMAVAERSLTGFEFAAGIPGTLGGAVMMNAGAYGGEIKDCIVSAEVMEPDGSIKTYGKPELALGYRTSCLQRTGGIVISAEFAFRKGNKQSILEQIEEMNRKRKEKQPLEFASAGSTFKRPEGQFAGKLIMDAGLRGFAVGGAQVSEKHCGFLINRGGCTAKDMKQLINEVIVRVENQFGVRLEPEVRFLGDDETQQ